MDRQDLPATMLAGGNEFKTNPFRKSQMDVMTVMTQMITTGKQALQDITQ